MRELTTKEVNTLLNEGVEHARSIKRPSTVVVVDMGGHVRGALRPENGRIANVEIARKKAWTAVAFQRPTDMVRTMMLPDSPGYGLQHTDSEICMVEGGLPIIDSDGHVIGGIGASGGSGPEDTDCCVAGLRKTGFPTEFTNPLASS